MGSLCEANSQTQDALQSLQPFRHKLIRSPPATDSGHDQVQARPDLDMFLFDPALCNTALRDEASP